MVASAGLPDLNNSIDLLIWQRFAIVANSYQRIEAFRFKSGTFISHDQFQF